MCGRRGGGRIKECLQSVSHSGPSDAHCVYLLLSLVEMRSGVTAAHLLSELRQKGDGLARDDTQIKYDYESFPG